MPKPTVTGKKPVAPTVSPPAGAIVGSNDALIGDFISPFSPAPLQTTESDDVIWAYAGDDFIFAAGGNDTIEAGLGNDFIDGGTGSDIINADAGNDLIIGGDGDDTINAGDGDDLIIGGNGSDTIDGGDGNDTLIYGGIEGVDYIETAIYGKGKNKDVIVGYEVFKVASGETDTVTNVETIDYSALIVTASDGAIIAADETAVLDVLANDVQTGSLPGANLSLTAIYDAPWLGLDLIPDGAEEDITLFYDGELLNDGSILTVNAETGVITWDPNGAYDTEPAPGEPDPWIYFWYDVEGLGDEVATGDVVVQVVYTSDPVPGSVIDFDYMVDLYNGNLLFEETADTTYILAQQTSGTGVSGTSAEYRDISAEGNYNYDTEDDDLEWRVWTDPDGTTHELNIAREDFLDFNIATVKFTGFEADDEVTIAYSIAPGQPNEGVIYEEHTVTFANLAPDGTYTFVGGTSIGQLNIIAAAGDEVFVDDIVIG